MTRRAAALAALLALAPALAAPAPAALPCELEARSGWLEVSLGLAAAFPAQLERELGNGLTNLVTLHVALLPARGGNPTAIFGREIEILYDVWEEQYGVVVRDPSVPQGRRHAFRTFRELRAFLSDARAIRLAPLPALGAGAWVVQARVELNPVSEELVRRTRELIADPASAGRGGPSRSVLGAMAGSMLRVEEGDDVKLFRSRAFEAREVPAR